MNEKKIPAPNEPDWFVPPGLFPAVEEFVISYGIWQNKSVQKRRSHLLIHGPRGVGKTLFTKIFEQCYWRDHKNQEKRQVKRVNCAAIPENLIESGLFGHVKGGFTGAVQDRKGYIEQAENAILVLEEIGEMPRSCHAKLLTFLDNGKYYPVGDDKEKEAENVQIIGTTNQDIFNEDKMRADFRDRFDLFYVPPISNRRGDVLYYLLKKYPDVVKVLCPYQVLTLLAYNWPGNVREIEEVAKTILMRREMARGLSQTGQKVYPFLLLRGKRHIGFNGMRAIELVGKLDSSFIESIDSRLRKTALRLSFSEEDAFPRLTEVKGKEPNYPDFLSYSAVNACKRIKEFERAYESFREIFCKEFKVQDDDNRDLLVEILDEIEKKREIGAAVNVPKDHWGAAIAEALIEKSLTSPGGKENIFTMTEKQLLRYYYKGLLKLTNNNKAKVARQAGLPPSTLSDKLKKLGL